MINLSLILLAISYFGVKIRDWDVYEIDCPMKEYLGQVEIEVEDGQELTCQFIYER